MCKAIVWSALSFVCAGMILSWPTMGVAQNLFEADQDSNTIYEYTTNGAQSTFATLSLAAGLAFDSAGDLFAASGNDVYVFVNNNGTLNSTPIVFASVERTFGLAYYNSTLFATFNNSLQIHGTEGIVAISPTGAQTTFASGLINPSGLAVDSAGDLFVLVTTNGSPLKGGPLFSGALIKITPDGTKSVFANGWTNDDMGVAINGSGDILVANIATNGTIAEYTPNGSQIATITGLDAPRFMAFDSFGNLFVGNSGNETIVKIAPNGSQTTFATGLDYPAGLAVQPPPALRVVGAGIQANVFEFTIVGSNNQMVVVESCTNLTNPVWLPQQTDTLSGESFYFSDPQWTNYSSRFYRVESP